MKSISILIVATVFAAILTLSSSHGWAGDGTPSWTVVSTGLEDHYDASVDGKRVGFIFGEWSHGDQNNDGDTRDNIAGFYDTDTKTWTAVPHEAWAVDVSGSLIAFYDPQRWAVSWYDIETDTVTELDFGEDWMRISGTTIVTEALESRVGTDANGDGDLNDWVLVAYDTDTEALTAISTSGYWPDIDGSIVVFHSYEGYEGVDLNGDGDTNDFVIGYHDLSTGVTHNTGQVGHHASVSGSLVAFREVEWRRGGDFNGDGDTSDWVTYLYDLGTGTAKAIGIGQGFVGGGIVGLETRERDVNVDLDGDGAITFWRVIRYYDVATETLVNTGVSGDLGGQPCVGPSLIAFMAHESWAGKDLTGDGDQLDSNVLMYITIRGPTSSSELEDLQDLVASLLADGDIDNAGIAVALDAHVTQAGARLDGDSQAGAARALNAFISLVKAQSGKHIAAAAATLLAKEAEEILNLL